MGRPFEQEISAIESTINEALTVNPVKFIEFIKKGISSPFLAVGSGGSIAVAQLFCLVIQELGGFAKSITPYDLFVEKNNLQKTNVVIFTAGGSNPDIINAYNYLVQNETKNVFVACMRTGSLLIELLKENNNDYYLEFEVPNGKDGFLAVNSTMAVTTILYKLYIGMCFSNKEFLSLNIDSCSEYDLSVITKETIVVLGGNWTMPVVYDFESKCTEAGLVNVQCANFRNFAHGRHHWLAKHSENSSVICFISPKEKKLANKTLHLIPNEIPKLIIETEHSNICGAIDLFIKMFKLVNDIGKNRQIDPGRPHVPKFGRDLYHVKFNLNSIDTELKEKNKDSRFRAVERKFVNYINGDISPSLKEVYFDGYDQFTHKVKNTIFTSMVLDYDNTIIKDNDSNSNIYRDIILILNELLNKNIYIGIATGRGKSVREQLAAVIPEVLWEKLFIGYYNGSLICQMSIPPTVKSSNNKDILNIMGIIKAHSFFTNHLIEQKGEQITLIADSSIISNFKTIIDEIILKDKFSLKTMTSDHSLDILPFGFSKLSVVEKIEEISKGNVLCIGDSGNVQGNDYDLLCSEFSFSVDKISMSPDTCWNLAPLGLCGPTATLNYLKNIELVANGFRISNKLFK